MSSASNKNNQLIYAFIFAICFTAITAMILMVVPSNTKQTQNLNAGAMSVSAPDSADAIIGQVDTGSAIELSFCFKATPGPIKVGNTSIWFKYNPAALTPVSEILEIGDQYDGTPDAGYGLMKWEGVLGDSDIQSLSQSYNPEFGTGAVMATDTPELFAKVKFNKKAGATASTAITTELGYPLVFSNYMVLNETTSNPTDERYEGKTIAFNVTNVTTDCRTVAVAASSSSAVVSSSNSSAVLSSSSTVSSSSSTATNAVSSSSTVTTVSSTLSDTDAKTANLIIGKSDTPTGVEVSVCVKSTSNPLRLANVSTWFQYDRSSFMPASAILEKGVYGNTTNGYGLLKFERVNNQSIPPLDTYGLRLDYNGTGSGIVMNPTTNELFGKVKFGKISNSNGSKSINLFNSRYFAIETPNVEIILTKSFVSGDCRNSTTAIPNIGRPVPNFGPQVTVNQGRNFPEIQFNDSTILDNTPASFKIGSSPTVITGKIVNGRFIPNAGQVFPSSFGLGQTVGLFTVGEQEILIQLNVAANCEPPITGCATPGPSNSGSGGNTITINNNVASSSSSSSAVNNEAVLATTPQTNITNNSTFQDKLKITDPYICGVGSYGNIANHKEFGVNNVFYDLYKSGATTPSYFYELKLNDQGDFFLPISPTTNIITDGKYRVVYYAISKDGDKAQGEYTDNITSNCNTLKVNTQNDTSVRTGGSDTAMIALSLILMITSFGILAFKQNKATNYSYKSK